MTLKTKISERVELAVKKLGLKVRSMTVPRESHSSIVRLLKLKSGEDAVLKLPWNLTKFEREFNALNALKKSPLVPKLLDSYLDKKEGHAGMLMTRLPGRPISSANTCTGKLAEQIGEAIARFHGISLPNLAGEKSHTDWWGSLSDNISNALGRCRNHEKSRDWDLVEKYFSDIRGKLPRTTALKFTHFDFRLGNLLRDKGELSGIIDFESSRNGSASFDLAEICIRGWDRSPALKRAMLKGYDRIRPVPSSFEMTIPIYGLSQSLMRVNFCLKRGSSGGVFYAENRKAIKLYIKELM